MQRLYFRGKYDENSFMASCGSNAPSCGQNHYDTFRRLVPVLQVIFVLVAHRRHILRSRLAACELAATGAKMKASERLLICSRILLLVALVTFFWRGGRGGVGGRRWEASVEESKARLQVRVQELLGCTFCLSCLQGGGGRLV